MKNKKRMTVLAFVLASAMFIACGNSAETGNTMETKEGSVAAEAAEEESAVSETEDSTEEKDVAVEETETAVESEEPTETENGESAPVRKVDAKMVRFIEVIKGYGVDSMEVFFQDSSMPQPDGIEVSDFDMGRLSYEYKEGATGVVQAARFFLNPEGETEEEQDAGASAQGNGTSADAMGKNMQPGYIEYESAEAAASAFLGIREYYASYASNPSFFIEELEITDTRQTYYLGMDEQQMYQLHEDTVYMVWSAGGWPKESAEEFKEKAGQLIEELIQY